MNESSAASPAGGAAPSTAADPSAVDVGARAALRLARARAARPYLLRWRPTVATGAFVATAALTAAFPEDARPAVLAVIAILFVTTWIAALVVRLGAPTHTVAVIVTLLDVPLITAWAIATGSIGETMSALIGTVLVAAWLFGPRPAAFIGACSIAATLLVWFGYERWAAPQALPDVAWVLLGGTILAVALATEVDRALVDATRTLRRTNVELQELDTIRRRLVADVSHELRTPLTAINGFLDTVLRDDLDLDTPVLHELLVEARRGGARLEQLVADLLDVERSESGAIPLALERLRVGPLLTAAVRAVPLPPDRRVEVAFGDPSASDAWVLADERRFEQVIANMVRNAIEHGRGTVTLRCVHAGPTIRIDVCDEGDGLEDGTELHAFEPFTTFGEHHGSPGLGLSIARAFATAHGGSLVYVPRAEPHGGHAFRLQLPRAHGDDPQLAPEPA